MKEAIEALKLIAAYGGSEIQTEAGILNCNGYWCAEQAARAVEAIEAKQKAERPKGKTLVEVFAEEERKKAQPDPQDREWLSQAAKAAHERMPDGWCFILMAANVGDNGRLVYSSNMTRPSAINVLKEWLIKASGEEEWMKHIE